MGATRVLMIVAETLAVGAVAVQFVLPIETLISVHIGNRSLGLPVRWVVPLFFLAIAGTLSLATLVGMYWRLAHITLPPAVQ